MISAESQDTRNRARTIKVLGVIALVVAAYIIQGTAGFSAKQKRIVSGLEETFLASASKLESSSSNEKWNERVKSDVDTVEEPEQQVDVSKLLPQDCRRYSKLPRTSKRPYNVLDPGKKYLTYSPSGGFNNQLVEFVTAIILAKKFKRELLVPPHGMHSNLYYGFERLKVNEMIPMDTTFDFEYFEQRYGVELVPATLPLSNLTKIYKQGHKSVSKVKVIDEHALTKGSKYYSLVTFPKKVRSLSSQQLVYVYGRFFTPIWIEKDITFWNVRYAPYLRELALKITDAVFEKQTLNGINQDVVEEDDKSIVDDQWKDAVSEILNDDAEAIQVTTKKSGKAPNFKSAAVHIRLGDVRHEHRSSRYYVKVLKERLKVDPNTVLYVAAEEKRDDPYFADLREAYHNLVFADDLRKLPELKEALEEFDRFVEGNKIRNDLFGLVEQLICIRADAFLGTITSTFTRTIYNNRSDLKNALPELDITASAFDSHVRDRMSARMRYGGDGPSPRNDRSPFG